ncbi:MAG: hypothetical protein IPJ67_04300 [Candidatus Moraniibacteriota bacterium]|nr:MAG: hypothetical protein IPJ67_04300 [Candidatus Moranbacteria bacterium]
MSRKQELLFKSKEYRCNEFYDLIEEGLARYYGFDGDYFDDYHEPFDESDSSWLYDDSESDGFDDDIPWTAQDARDFVRDFELAVDMFEFALTEKRMENMGGIKLPDASEDDDFFARFKRAGYESAERLGI